jgi:cell wall-associated NlpC family hydrolase
MHLLASTPARRLLLALALVALVAAGAPAHAQARATGARVVAYAERYLGTPYRYGAVGPSSFDCSGFTGFVFAHFGRVLPRTSYDQLAAGTAVTGALHRGDLLFWDAGGHVGIYVGARRFISATVHRGIAVYPLRVWRRTQSFTAARRILAPGAPAPRPVAGGGGAAVGAAPPMGGAAPPAS